MGDPIVIPAHKEDSTIHLEEKSSEDPSGDVQNDHVTFKTWIVIAVLSLQYGVSFYPVPTVTVLASSVATKLGDPVAASWYVEAYLLAITIGFMLCGANSDLFGRRYFILGGNVLNFIGNIIAGTAKVPCAVTIGMAFSGFGGGNCQLAVFALPELMPNKWRHIGVVVADLWIFFSVLVGPASARFAINAGGDAWRWHFYGPAITHVLCGIALAFLYFPPAHPRGVPWKQALKGLDWGGAALFIIGAPLTLAGIILTIQVGSSDKRVIITLCLGFFFILLFGIWEVFSETAFRVKYPLCPRHVFVAGNGRDLTAPFLGVFVVTMFYYMTNVVWPTMLSLFWSDTLHDELVFSVLPNVTLVTGGLSLAFFGGKIKHWRWTLSTAVFLMVFFGALLGMVQPNRRAMMTAFVCISQLGFGWAQYLVIAFTQLGVDQVELGISGALAGMARYAGGCVAVSVYQTILTNVQATQARKLIPAAAIAAGLPESSVSALLSKLPLGNDAVEQIPGMTEAILTASHAAFNRSYVIGFRTTALSSLAFGVIGLCACLWCRDIENKMTPKIEIFLENDVNAEKNRFH